MKTTACSARHHRAALHPARLKSAAAFSLGLVVAGMSPFGPQSAQAASATWNAVPTNGNWEAAGAENNWSTGVGTFPGDITGSLTNTDTATFSTTTISTVAINSTAGNATPLNIRSLTFGIGGAVVASAYTIGSTVGNSLLLTSGGTIQIVNNSGSNTQTVNAPLVLLPTTSTTAGTYSFTNNSGSGGQNLIIGGTVTGGTTTQGITLTLGGGSGPTGNSVNGVISNGGAVGGVSISKIGNSPWNLSGVNTFTGGISITGGSLGITGAGQLGSGSYAGAISSSGTISFASTAANTLTGAITGTGTLNTGAASGTTTLSGGSFAGATINQNNTTGTSTLVISGGETVTLTGNLNVASNNSNQNSGTVLGSSTVNVNAITVGRASVTQTTPFTAGFTDRGLYVNGSTLGVTTTFGIGTSGSANSSAFARIDSGNVTVGGTTTITASSTRVSLLDMVGGTFTSNDTVGAGILIGGIRAAAAGQLLVRGGTLTTNKITLGDATQTSGSDTLSFLGGTTYIGSGGIVAGGATGTTTLLIQVGGATYATAPTIGTRGVGGWSSSLNMTLTNSSSGAASTFQAEDSVASGSTARDIGLSGILSGTGGLIKTGGGTLTLSGTNTYTGATTISAGTLSVSTLANGGANSNLGASASTATNLVLNGGTLQYTGAAVSTDRLFSLQSSSAIDASGTGAVNFTNAGAIGFNDGTAAKTLTLTGTNTGNNTLAAIIGNNTGATSLTKSGTGTWVLSGVNTFTGDTNINAGTLAVDGAGQLGSGAYAGNIVNTGTLAYSSTATQTLFGIISGAGGSLTKDEASTLTLSGANTYTGGTTITGGTLIISATGSLAVAGTVTVGNGTPNSGTLGGDTLLGVGNIVLNDGGTVAPGLSPGTLAGTSLTWSPGGTLDFELVNPGLGLSDLLNLTGAFNGVGAPATSSFIFDFLLSTPAPGTYTLVDYGTTNFVATDFDYTGLGGSATGVFNMNTGNGSLEFIVTAVPEPSRAMLLGMAALLTLGRRRRRA